LDLQVNRAFDFDFFGAWDRRLVTVKKKMRKSRRGGGGGLGEGGEVGKVGRSRGKREE
jgi:hypothetical protein